MLRHTIDDRADAPKMAAGWHLCLVAADHALAGEDVAPIRGEVALDYGWQDLHDRYAAELAVDEDDDDR